MENLYIDLMAVDQEVMADHVGHDGIILNVAGEIPIPRKRRRAEQNIHSIKRIKV